MADIMTSVVSRGFRAGFGIKSIVDRIAIYGAIVLIVFSLGFAGYKAYQEKSIVPLVYLTIGKVVIADQDIYENVKLLKLTPEKIFPENRKDLNIFGFLRYIVWRKVYYFFNIITDMFFIFFFVWLIYKLISLVSQSTALLKWLKAVGYVVLIYLFVSIFFIFFQYSEKQMPDKITMAKMIGYEMIPFKGVWTFFIFLGDLIIPKFDVMEKDWFQRLFNTPLTPEYNYVFENSTNATGV